MISLVLFMLAKSLMKFLLQVQLYPLKRSEKELTEKLEEMRIEADGISRQIPFVCIAYSFEFEKKVNKKINVLLFSNLESLYSITLLTDNCFIVFSSKMLGKLFL